MALVRYNGKNVYRCGKVQLLPLVNEVDDSDLKDAMKHPLFKFRLESQIIEIIECKSENKSVYKKREKSLSENKPIYKKREKSLAELVPEIYDESLLKKYVDESEDKKVVKAAKKQLKKIDETNRVKKEENGKSY